MYTNGLKYAKNILRGSQSDPRLKKIIIQMAVKNSIRSARVWSSWNVLTVTAFDRLCIQEQGSLTWREGKRKGGREGGGREGRKEGGERAPILQNTNTEPVRY